MPLERLEQFLADCRAAQVRGELFQAVRAGEAAVALAEDLQALEPLGRAHLELGCTYTEMGDARLGEAHLTGYLAMLPELGAEARWEGRARTHLAAIHQQRRQWAAAIGELEQAARLAGTGAERAAILLELAWCCLLGGHAREAGTHLLEVEADLSSLADPAMEAAWLSRKAHATRAAGRLAESAALCEEVFTPGRPGVTDRHLAEAAWVMGENALDLGHTEEASLFARLALEHAVKANWPTLMNLAGGLRRRINEAEGN